MSRIAIVTPETTPPASTPLLEQLRHRGLTPSVFMNLHAQMAYAPSIIGAYIGARHAVAEWGTLDPRARSAVMLAVSATHGATYAQAVNAVLARRAGWMDEQIAEIMAGTFDDDAKIAAMLRVAREAARDVGHVAEGTWQAALDAGWSDAELADAFASIGLTTFVDYFVNFAQTPLDLPAPPMSGRPVLSHA